MNFDGILGIASGLVAVAMVTTIVMRGSESAKVITALGNAFQGSVRAAIGK